MNKPPPTPTAPTRRKSSRGTALIGAPPTKSLIKSVSVRVTRNWALTEQPPAARDPGTLAAVGAAADGGAKIVRVHDVAGTRDFLRVHDALRHGADDGLELAPGLRREAV